VTTLAGLGEAAAVTSAASIIVIGPNVKLREGLDWLGGLSGKALEPYPLGREALEDAG